MNAIKLLQHFLVSQLGCCIQAQFILIPFKTFLMPWIPCAEIWWPSHKFSLGICSFYECLVDVTRQFGCNQTVDTFSACKKSISFFFSSDKVIILMWMKLMVIVKVKNYSELKSSPNIFLSFLEFSDQSYQKIVSIHFSLHLNKSTMFLSSNLFHKI